MTFALTWPGAILAELDRVFASFEPGPLDELGAMISAAGRVVCAGQGRSGLIAAAFAVRLRHLGVETHVAGEATQPAVDRNDLVVAVSRTGATAVTVHQAERAHAAGARVAVMTARGDSRLASLADRTIVLPVGDVHTAQYAGSLFEQAALIAADSLAASLQQARGLGDSDLSARHDNLQ